MEWSDLRRVPGKASGARTSSFLLRTDRVGRGQVGSPLRRLHSRPGERQWWLGPGGSL